LAIDTKIGDTLDIPLAELNKKFDFFLPWAGLEKAQAQGENPQTSKQPKRWQSYLICYGKIILPQPRRKFTLKTFFYQEFYSVISRKTQEYLSLIYSQIMWLLILLSTVQICVTT
jgi:hypothetical protein